LKMWPLLTETAKSPVWLGIKHPVLVHGKNGSSRSKRKQPLSPSNCSYCL